MIENVYGISLGPEMVGGEIRVQYDSHGPDIGVGITLNRANLVQYLADNPEPDGIGTAANPDNGLEFYVRLERASANRLIRLLRKARDTAFGRDE